MPNSFRLVSKRTRTRHLFKVVRCPHFLLMLTNINRCRRRFGACTQVSGVIVSHLNLNLAVFPGPLSPSWKRVFVRLQQTRHPCGGCKGMVQPNINWWMHLFFRTRPVLLMRNPSICFCTVSMTFVNLLAAAGQPCVSWYYHYVRSFKTKILLLSRQPAIENLVPLSTILGNIRRWLFSFLLFWRRQSIQLKGRPSPSHAPNRIHRIAHKHP